MWQEWFTTALQPGQHMVRIAQDLADLPSTIASLRQNDTLAQGIGAAGRALARELLAPTNILCYTRDLLREYARRQTYVPDLPPNAGDLLLSNHLLVRG